MTVPEPNSLEDLCQRAAQLAQVPGGQLKCVRVRAGDLSVEVEWVASAPLSNSTRDHDQSSPDDPAGMVGDDTSEAIIVRAPLVGTFYRAPSPGAKPFAEVGTIVEEGQQVAIIEAMKLMNTVTVTAPGRVTQVLVEDGTSVEYGEALLVLTPA